MDKTHKCIAKSAVIMTIVSSISLVFSFVQESVFAYFYGANTITDAYTIATQIPVVLFSLISTAISTVVIPCYSKELYNKGKESAGKYVSNLITAIGGITLFFILIGEVFAKYIILAFAPGMDSTTRILAVQIFRITLPTIFFTEIMNINIGVLNVHKSFVLPALTSNILNVIFVMSISVLARTYGIYAAVMGTVIGTSLEFIYSVALRRKFVKYHFILSLKDKSMIKSFKMAIPVFIGISAAEINKIVDKMVSSFLSEGSISTLNYASKLSSAVSALLISSITTVIYPEFSKSSAENDDKNMADVFGFSLRVFLILIIPIIIGGTILSKEIIKIVYGRGAFEMSMVNRTAPLFSCYLVCLLFSTFRQTSSRVFYSYGDSKTPMKNSLIGIVINIVLNIILGFFVGALGLALATTISTAVISFLLLRDVRKKNVYVEYQTIIGLLIKVIVASGLMGVVIKLTKLVILHYKVKILTNDVIFLLFAVILGAGSYFGMLYLLRVDEMRKVFDIIKQRKKV